MTTTNSEIIEQIEETELAIVTDGVESTTIGNKTIRNFNPVILHQLRSKYISEENQRTGAKCTRVKLIK